VTGGEVVVEDSGLISGLDDERLGGRSLRDGDVAPAGDRGRGGPPGLLLLLCGLVPRRKRPGAGAAAGFISGSCEVLEVGAGHTSMMPEE
jgi:hypothetical protein